MSVDFSGYSGFSKKTDRHFIVEILLKGLLNIITFTLNPHRQYMHIDIKSRRFLRYQRGNQNQ